MDPTSWSAYSQHLSRLGASINHPSGALSQQAQMNDLALSSSLQRQEHISGYGNAGGPHPFLLAASHGLNPSQANHSDPSFNANLFANYDASLFSTTFPPGNKGHLSFPQGAAGLFKAVNRENEFSDLRTGFSHCGMSAYARNSDANNGLPSGSGHLFPNSMPPGSWRHSGIIPSSCGPFGVLPHETVLQRSHLVGRASDKLSVQASKQARASLQNASFVEQDLSRGYRTILSSPARAPSSFVDGSNTSHSSLLSPQNDPFFSSVNENFYSSCSKNDFAAYSSYCSNVQSGVQRSSLSPYCYSQAFANFEPNTDKADAPTTSTSSSANTSFSNFVPNSNLNGNSSHLHNGQISRQSVITTNVSSNSMVFDSESHQQSPAYNVKEPFSYQPGSAHANSCASHSNNSNNNSSSGSNSSRQATAHNSHHSSGQTAYPPMSTPIPASTPAHTTPPSSMGQAYVPIPLPMSHDSGCSSVNSQSVMYHSPSNDGCYSTPGTCPSESGSPAKQDMSQHSSPSVYSIESSNLSINSAPYADSHPVRAHSNSENNFGKNGVANGGVTSDIQDSTNDSAKLIEEKLQDVNRHLLATCTAQHKDMHLASMVPIDMVKVNKENVYQTGNPQSRLDMQTHEKRMSSLPSRSGLSLSGSKNELFAFSDSSSVLDFTPKVNAKSKRGHKRKCNQNGNPLPLNCTYSHLQNSQQQSPSPDASNKTGTDKPDESDNEFESSVVNNNLPNVSDSSPLPVDLSQVTMNLSIKKSESSVNSKKKDNMPELNYESTETSSGKWTIKKPNTSEIDKIQTIDTAENLSRDCDIKKINKCQSPICRTPPLDDLSDESKKLCNSIEDDLGFLAGLSSDPDVEDSASKGSFSEKKSKKDQGFLQSFLTFLESSNEPPVNSDPVNLERKNDKQDNSESHLKSEADKKTEIPQSKVDEGKNDLIDQHDKDNFDETPSLDPTLFGCTTLQKEMVVPNPEAPSFSSDEDENSTQGIFDSVAMAIQRLCEDNEDDHIEKMKSMTPKCNSNVDETPDLLNVAQPSSSTEQVPEDQESLKEDKVKECTIKSACVVKTRRGKRRKARHLLVIKVKRTADKSPNSVKTVPEKPKPTRSSPREVQIVKTVQKNVHTYQRRTLMRKCKERGLRKRNSTATRRKRRNCVKRKYDEEPESNSTSAAKDEQPKKSVQEVKKTVVDDDKPSPVKTESVTPKKPKPVYRGRPRRRRRGPHKKPVTEEPPQTVTSEPKPKVVEEEAVASTVNENPEVNVPQKVSNIPDNSETQFKTGDYVISIENKENEKPPIWRIEGKNVLQLFEPVEGQNNNSILYRNTSSYSRWSPSSKYKYSKQPVKVIKSDDDTVIVELIKNIDKVEEKDTSGSCDYTLHPQRENFEVYLQTLVSQVLDPEFIPEIIKENDEYFLSHLKAIEDITSAKKNTLHQSDKWSTQLLNSVTTYPYVSVSKRQDDENILCQVCNVSKIQFTVHFHGQIYNPLTLESKAEGQSHPVCDFNFPLCGSCVQTVTLYSRLHHHKYHFFQLGCKKVKDVNKGIEKPSHTVLEECLQDTEWVLQMFQDMLEMWNACDKYR